VERSIQPSQYLDWLQEQWNPATAAEALGCTVAEIRSLQQSHTFVSQFLSLTVGATGPMSMRQMPLETIRDMVDRDKIEFYFNLKEIATDLDKKDEVRLKALNKLFDTAANVEGLGQKIQHEVNVTHRLDPESAKQLEEARMESQRLLGPIDMGEAERV